METTETTLRIGDWTVCAVWTKTSRFPSELHITTEDPRAAEYGITSALLRNLELIQHPDPPEAGVAMDAAFDALRVVRDLQNQGKGPVDDDYLKALVSAYVAMNNAGVASPIEKMSFFLPSDLLAIERDLKEAINRGFIG
ncbi:hypothetical protein AB0D71_14865 [Streptomyces avermitilis]|uniref:hypothetical protein n=1 Tax=Streptomyces avermitilis TaxID=33903 RepID=UPI0033CD5F80